MRTHGSTAFAQGNRQLELRGLYSQEIGGIVPASWTQVLTALYCLSQISFDPYVIFLATTGFAFHWPGQILSTSSGFLWEMQILGPQLSSTESESRFSNMSTYQNTLEDLLQLRLQGLTPISLLFFPVTLSFWFIRSGMRPENFYF